jgi:hypothetical protein
MSAYCEAIWFGKNNKSVALASFRKQMRSRIRAVRGPVQELRYRRLPLKPYPMEEVIQTEIENLSPTILKWRQARQTSSTRAS